MPQISQIFASASIMTLEKKLLGKDDIGRIADGDYDNAIRVLHERNYGGEATASNDFEELIEGQLKEAKKTLQALAADERIANAFLLKRDMQNLKMLVKLRLLGKELQSQLDSKGVIEVKLMQLMVKNWMFTELPESIAERMTQLDKKLAVNKDPQMVSIDIDKAYYEYVRSLDNEFLSRYFGVECDFINILTLLRCMGKSYDGKVFANMLMPQYEIPTALICGMFESGNVDLKKLASSTEAVVRRYIMRAADGESVNAIRLEKAKDDCLMALARENKNDMQSPYPVIWYYLARQRESEIIRLAITLKRSGAGHDIIRERLRELYG